MSEKQKPRKSHPGHNTEPNWRTRQQCNKSKLKYLRDTVLEKFQPSESLPIPVPEDIMSVFLPVSSLPSCSPGKFMHGLGDSVNSRKFFPKEKMNEKGHAEVKKKEENDVKVENKEERTEKEQKAKEVEKKEKVEKREKVEKNEKPNKEEKKEISEIWDMAEVEEEVKEEKVNIIKSESENTLQVKENEKKGKDKDGDAKESANEDFKKTEKPKGKKEVTVKKDTEENPNLSHLAEKGGANPNSKQTVKEKPKQLPKDSKKNADQSKSPFGPSKQAPEPSKNLPEIEKKLQDQPKNAKDKKTQPENPKIPEAKPQKKSAYPDNSNMPNTQKLNYSEIVQKPISAPVFPVPTLDKSQLASFSTAGNPFAKILLFTGKSGDDHSKFYFPAESKVYERLWFYKDPQERTQGPFSCLEMYNWVTKGCFPDSLQIAFCNSEFLPMGNYSATKPEIPTELDKKNPWSNSAKLFSKENNKKK